MPEYLTLKEAFLKCRTEGKYKVKARVEIEEIKATVKIAEADVESAEFLKSSLAKNSNQWSTVYKLYYDAIHELTESFLRFEKIKSDNHQCLFAYLCEKYPELEFNWDFFELIRTKRNGLHYYGQPTSYEDWKKVELQFSIYIKTLKEEIRKKLDNTP
jgi:hypothetical protein